MNTVLEMPAVTFFAMLKACRQIDAYHKIDMCDISSIGIANGEWYQKIRHSFSERLMDHKPERLKAVVSHPQLDAASPDAKNLMFAVVRQVKRYHGG